MMNFFVNILPNHKDRLKYFQILLDHLDFALILKNKNYLLFVDGRYTLQAQRESKKFFNIITIPSKKINHILKNNLLIGFDPKLITRKTLDIFFKNNCNLPIKNNLIDKIWKRKNKNKKVQIYTLSDSML